MSALEAQAQPTLSADAPVLDLASVIPRERLAGLQDDLRRLERCMLQGRWAGLLRVHMLACTRGLPARRPFVPTPNPTAPPLACRSETGWRVRVLTRYGKEGPSVEELRREWATDARTVVMLVDPSCEPAPCLMLYMGRLSGPGLAWRAQLVIQRCCACLSHARRVQGLGRGDSPTARFAPPCLPLPLPHGSGQQHPTL